MKNQKHILSENYKRFFKQSLTESFDQTDLNHNGDKAKLTADLTDGFIAAIGDAKHMMENPPEGTDLGGPLKQQYRDLVVLSKTISRLLKISFTGGYKTNANNFPADDHDRWLYDYTELFLYNSGALVFIEDGLFVHEDSMWDDYMKYEDAITSVWGPNGIKAAKAYEKFRKNMLSEDDARDYLDL